MWMSDRPTTLFAEIGEAFMRLLGGRLEWDAATSPTLPALPSSDATKVPETGYKDT